MPRKGFTTITISDLIHKKAKEKMDAINKKAGYRKFRSLSHFVEVAIMELSEKIAEGST